MESDFQITRKIFLSLKTGWFDNSKGKSNLVNAYEITIPQIQGRYRLNANDSKLKIQEFFFDAEWSAYAENGEKIAVITKEIVNANFPKLKKAAKRILFPILKYIPKKYVYIRASGTGIHIIFFLKGINNMEEWRKITSYLIRKSKLKNTKNAKQLIFGLDKDTILSSDRKVAEFGSWNKLKKDFKEEVSYLNYATFLSVDAFLKAKEYPFCPTFADVQYPERYQCLEAPKRLIEDAKNANLEAEESPITPAKEGIGLKNNDLPLSNSEKRIIKNFEGTIPESDPAYRLINRCRCYWNMLRDENATWYARQFLVKFLKYSLRLDREQILKLIDKYNAWSDYNPRITAFYVNKHFRKGTCETKVMKPARKKTLVKYNLCGNRTGKCVYSQHRQNTEGEK